MTIRLVAVFILVIMSFELNAQNGYVKLLENDSVIYGYLRHAKSVENGQREMEVWRTKNDKDPMHLDIASLGEYAINKDTFRVLQNFKPFADQETYFEVTEVPIIAKGKINLLRFGSDNFWIRSNLDSRYIPVGMGLPTAAGQPVMIFKDQPFIYILEDSKTGYRRAISDEDEKMKEQLLDFFTESYLKKYEQFKKKIKYKTIPDLVKLYNSK